MLLADHPLAEVRLRYTECRQPAIPREWRMCRLCGAEIEDTLHAPLVCTGSRDLSDIRKEFWESCGVAAARFNGLSPLEALPDQLLDDALANILAKFCHGCYRRMMRFLYLFP